MGARHQYYYDYRKGKQIPFDTQISPNNWKRKSQETNLTENEIRDHIDKVNWKAISNKQNLTESFIREFDENLNWKAISNSQELAKDFIREHAKKIYWRCILQHFKFDVDFLDEMSSYFITPIEWGAVCEYQKLDQKFIDKYADYLIGNEQLISKQRLSEEFMRLWRNKLNWYHLIANQKLSESFIEENIDRIGSWRAVFKYQKHLSPTFKKKHKKY